jgi:hypothetical protein
MHCALWPSPFPEQVILAFAECAPEIFLADRDMASEKIDIPVFVYLQCDLTRIRADARTDVHTNAPGWQVTCWQELAQCARCP